MKKKCLFSLGAALIVLSGCSVKNPDISDVRTILEGKIKNESEGRIKLVSLEKTDGVAQEVAGVKGYEIEYKGEIEFLEDCYWGTFGMADGSWSGDFYTAGGTPTALSAFSPQYQGKKKAKKGGRESITGKFEFVKSEKGWQVEN